MISELGAFPVCGGCGRGHGVRSVVFVPFGQSMVARMGAYYQYYQREPELVIRSR